MTTVITKIHVDKCQVQRRKEKKDLVRSVRRERQNKGLFVAYSDMYVPIFIGIVHFKVRGLSADDMIMRYCNFVFPFLDFRVDISAI